MNDRPTRSRQAVTTQAGNGGAPTVSFTAVLEAVGETGLVWLVRVPGEVSARLPSRGQVAVGAVFGGHDVRTVLEPDGRRGHWMRVQQSWARTAEVAPGETVEVAVHVVADWPEPVVPSDLTEALAAAPQKIKNLWKDITPMARWEWVRWVGATRNAETRQRRVEVSIDKIDHGKRRPCCFDLSSCTDPDVSTSGKLIGPS